MSIPAPGARSSPTGRKLPCRSSRRDLAKRGLKCPRLIRASICSQTALSHLHRTKVRGLSVTQSCTSAVPTERHKQFPAYQSGREFDDALVEQLEVLPEFVAACGFANAKAPGDEADDFLAAAVAAEERRGGTALVASGDRDTFQLASETTTILHPLRGGEIARIGP